MREPLYGRCPECGTSLPNPWTDRCKHRRACEARQMLHDGAPSHVAAAHAQKLRGAPPRLEASDGDA